MPDLPGMPGRHQLRRRPVHPPVPGGDRLRQPVGVLRRPAQTDHPHQRPPAAGDRRPARSRDARHERRHLPRAGRRPRRRGSRNGADRSTAKSAPRPARGRLPGRKHGARHLGRGPRSIAGRVGGANHHRWRTAGSPRRRARSSVRPGLGGALPRAAETGLRSPCHREPHVTRTRTRSRPWPPWCDRGRGRHAGHGQGRRHRPGHRRRDSLPDAGAAGRRPGRRRAGRWDRTRDGVRRRRGRHGRHPGGGRPLGNGCVPACSPASPAP